jgi:hypothetical protein
MSANLFKIFDAGPEKFERVSRLFSCKSCKRDVMRGGKFMAEVQDFIMFAGCDCLTISYFELENAPPTPKSWRGLLKLARVHGVEAIVFDPNSNKGGIRYGRN